MGIPCWGLQHGLVTAEIARLGQAGGSSQSLTQRAQSARGEPGGVCDDGSRSIRATIAMRDSWLVAYSGLLRSLVESDLLDSLFPDIQCELIRIPTVHTLGPDSMPAIAVVGRLEKMLTPRAKPASKAPTTITITPNLDQRLINKERLLCVLFAEDSIKVAQRREEPSYNAGTGRTSANRPPTAVPALAIAPTAVTG